MSTVEIDILVFLGMFISAMVSGIWLSRRSKQRQFEKGWEEKKE